MASARRQKRGLIGVEMNDAEIRIVEVRLSSGKPIVLAAGSIPMPPHTFSNGEVLRAEPLGSAIRKLFETAGIAPGEAVFSIPVGSYLTRALKIPPAPPQEQAIFVDGEVRHFGILQTPDGAYDFFPLESRDVAENSILLMAAEGPVAASVQPVAERAGLVVAALEPAALAMLRGAVATSEGFADGLFLVVGEVASEICIIHNKRICLYRRIDVGTNSLFAAERAGPARVDHTVAKDTPEVEETSSPRVLQRGPSDTLVTEVRRTIDFFAREFPDVARPESARVLLSDPIAQPLEEVLAKGTQLEVQVVRPSGFIPQNESVAQTMSGETSYRYLAAYGLALRGSESASVVKPIDLFSRQRSIVQLESKRRTFAGSLVAAIAAIVLGIAGGYYFGAQANDAEAELFALNNEADTLRKRQQQSMAMDRKTAEQIAYFSKMGMPAVWLVDTIGSSLDQGVGVSQIDIAEGGSVTIIGEAANEQALLLSVQNLQSQRNLGMATINSFEKINRESQDPAIRFQIRLAGVMGLAGPRAAS